MGSEMCIRDSSCRAYDYKSNKGVTMETMYEIFLRLVYLVGIGVIYLDG